MNLAPFFILIVIGTSLWVGLDVAALSLQARRQGLMTTDGPDWVLALVLGGAGFMFCGVLWLLAFPAYLYFRPRVTAAIASGSKTLPDWLKIHCPGCKTRITEVVPYCEGCGAALGPPRH